MEVPGGDMADLTPERWRRLSIYLDEALSLDSGERRVWLEREVADPELRAKIAELAANADRTGGILDDAAEAYLDTLLHPEGPADETAPDPAGKRIGPYRIVREVGRGGMGVVFLAERADGQFDQRVALKLIKHGLDTDEISRRFQRERQILAQLEHPAIARILDGGVTDDHRPYFAMEFVDGVPLTRYCDSKKLTIEERLQVFSRVCGAVQYAHGRLVVHRDLKPSNILVSADGELKLVDFGIAKVLSDEDGAPDLTHTDGERPFTPAYASPEQLTGEPVSTATDIYTLGLVLYELLVGRHPFRGAVESDRGIENAILETDPVTPSRAVLKTTPEQTGASSDSPPDADGKAPFSASALSRRLAGDLDAIVLTALRKKAAHRYPSVEALGKDIDSHLAHRPIHARRVGVAARAAKFVRRHRLGVAATALVVLSIAAGFIGTVWQARQKALEAKKAHQVTAFVTGLFEAADPARARGEEITARELVEQGAARLEHELADQPELQAEMDLVLGRINHKLGLSAEALTLLDRSLERLQNVDRPEVLRTHANALRTKGAALVQLGKAEEAEPLLRAAAAEHKKLPESGFDRNLELAEDLDELSIALISLGRFEEAETAASESFELRLPLLGAHHPGIADSYNNLAVIQRQLGRLAEAEVNYKKALEIRIPTIGREHPDTANTLNNLAALLHYRGRYREAAEMFEELSVINRHLYGESHPKTVGGTNNLAAVLLKLGNFARAEELYEVVLSYWRGTASDQHPNALVTRANLALLYQLRGEARRGEAAATLVVDDSVSVLGGNHPVTAVLTARLASMLRELGHGARAKELILPALENLESAYGPEHLYVAGGLEELGRIEVELGAASQAEEPLRRAVAIRTSQAGGEAFETLAARAALAAAIRDAGSLAESEQILTADLAIGRGVLPEAHPVLIDLVLELGRTHAASGRLIEAETLLEEAVALANQRYGSEVWRTALAELRLAELSALRGRTAAARELAGKAAAVIAAELGADHPLVRSAREID